MRGEKNGKCENHIVIMIMITAMFTGSQHRDLGNALARGLGA